MGFCPVGFCQCVFFCPVGFCQCEVLSCGVLSVWGFVLWGFVLDWINSSLLIGGGQFTGFVFHGITGPMEFICLFLVIATEWNSCSLTGVFKTYCLQMIFKPVLTITEKFGKFFESVEY